MATDSFIRVPPDSTGKMVDAVAVTTGAGLVYRQSFTIGDPGAPEQRAGVSSIGLQIDGTGFTQAVSGSVTATITGTVAVTQSGAWNVGLLAGSAVIGGVTQSGTWSVAQSGNWTVSATQSGTWTAQQGSAPWTMAFNGPQPVYLDDQNTVVDDQGILFVNTNVDGSDISTGSRQDVHTGLLQQIVAGTPSSQQGTWSVAATQSGTWTIQQSTSFSGPQPVYLDDQNNVLDDQGIQYVNTNVDGADISTGTRQDSQTALLQQIVAGSPSSQQGAWTVSVSSIPLASNTALELGGQIQRVADLMEAVLLELRVHSTMIASLAHPQPEDPERIRSDMNLTLQ
jgi:hypothetical protein